MVQKGWQILPMHLLRVEARGGEWAESVPEAFVIHHFFEIAAQAQIAALSGGAEVIIPDELVCRKAAETMDLIEATKGGGKNWASCLRLANRLCPDHAL